MVNQLRCPRPMNAESHERGSHAHVLSISDLLVVVHSSLLALSSFHSVIYGMTHFHTLARLRKPELLQSFGLLFFELVEGTRASGRREWGQLQPGCLPLSV